MQITLRTSWSKYGENKSNKLNLTSMKIVIETAKTVRTQIVKMLLATTTPTILLASLAVPMITMTNIVTIAATSTTEAVEAVIKATFRIDAKKISIPIALAMTLQKTRMKIMMVGGEMLIARTAGLI